MQTMKKRLITFVLCICMMLANDTVLTTQAAGKNEVGSTESTVEETKELSGTCGKKLKWKLNLQSGELKITGSGEMEDMHEPDDEDKIYSPWWNYREEVKTIQIADSVTNVSENAFSGLSNLKSIKLGKNIKEIEASAFCDCSSLEKITLPNTVKKIGKYAFWNCESLKEIVIPNGVAKLEWYTFFGCSDLKKITIGKGIKSIEANAFGGDYKVETIKVVSGNKNYKVQDNILYDKNKTKILCVGKVKSGTVSVSSKVKYINHTSCGQVKKFAVSEDNKKYSAKKGSLLNKEGTELIRCPGKMEGSYEVPEGVTLVQSDAFLGCSNLKTIVAANDVENIYSYAINDCAELEKVVLGENVDSVEYQTIHKHVFFVDLNSCPKLKEFEVSENNQTYSTVDGVLFNKNKTVLLIYPNGHGETYTVPEHTKYIAYSNFAELKTLEIGKNEIRGLGQIVSDWTNLDKLIISDENPFYSAEDGVLYNKNKSKLINFYQKPKGEFTVPEMVKYIEVDAFYDCKDMTALKFSDHIENVGLFLSGCDKLKKVEFGKKMSSFEYEFWDGPFEGRYDKIEEFVVPEENQSFASVDGLLYNKSKKRLYRCGAGRKGKVVIPEGTEEIAGNAFDECYGVTEIVVPASVKEIPKLDGCKIKITRLKDGD